MNSSPHTRRDAQADDIVRALRSYGVLTGPRLMEACGAAHWPDSGFAQALSHAVSGGRVKRLGADLYEIVEQ
jgi:hypothetical protein